ncbi:hypothetical protein E1A91_A01G078600v1 [Gossypium mustelinum]|uniref:Uncharacterized protein n=1 Tax=Gossypium mustelinum TaxID=34275 RepID=A0A5D3AE63_GOSMU|nr:hypothetical protein E1A91_A01G078600v1 [Gossypium mustelinum]
MEKISQSHQSTTFHGSKDNNLKKENQRKRKPTMVKSLTPIKANNGDDSKTTTHYKEDKIIKGGDGVN